MLLALLAHSTTVIPVEVVQVRVILMSLCAGVGSAACILMPRFTLERKWTVAINVHYNKTIKGEHFAMLYDLKHLPAGKAVPQVQAQLCGVWRPCTC